MIKRLFSVAITVLLAVSSLGAMERKPRRVPAAQQKAREFSQQRRQGQPSSAPRRPAPAPQGPATGTRRPVKKAPKRPINKQAGQRRPLNQQRNNPRHQDEFDSEDDSSSCDCLSYDSSDEYLLDNHRPHEIFNNQPLDDTRDYDNFIDFIDDIDQTWFNEFDTFDGGHDNNNNMPNVQIQQPAQQSATPRNPVNTQPTVQNTNQQVDGNCTICMDGLQGGNDVVSTRCGHHFHGPCLDGWRRSDQNQAGNCPVCRAQI